MTRRSALPFCRLDYFPIQQLARAVPQLPAAGQPHGEQRDQHAGDDAGDQRFRRQGKLKLHRADRALPNRAESPQHDLRVDDPAESPEHAAHNRQHGSFREEEPAHLTWPQPEREQQPRLRIALLKREDE